MTYQELYDASLALVGEYGTNADTSDYLERAPFLLASGYSECTSLDAVYRRSTGIPSVPYPTVVCVTLSDPFPLAEVFALPVTYYLSAMLTIEESEELSDRFFSLYTDAMESIRASLTAKTESITDRYHLN